MSDNKLRDLVSSCLKKKRYPSEAAVKNVIHKVYKDRKTILRYYFCKHCLGYHLTHVGIKGEQK